MPVLPRSSARSWETRTLAIVSCKMRLKDGRIYEGVVVREGVEIFAPAGRRRAEALELYGRQALQHADALWTRAAIAIASVTDRDYEDELGPHRLSSLAEDGRAGILAAAAPALAWASAMQARGDGRLSGEADARQALRRSVDAFNLLEEHPRLGATAHRRLHVLGELVSVLYGCNLRAEGRTFADDCPVSIAHRRVGLSPGFTAVWRCSACGEDFSECDHSVGELVEVVVTRHDGLCNVCWLAHCEAHQLGSLVRKRVGRIVTEADIEEISLVPRPRDPLARLTRIDLRPREAHELLRIGAIRRRDQGGAQCFRCRGGCGGFLSLDQVVDPPQPNLPQQ